MDDTAPKCTKITIRAEFSDGTIHEFEAAEPDKVTFDASFTDAAKYPAKPDMESVHIVPGLGRAIQHRSWRA